MTHDYIREMLEASVADPIAMSERLRINMTDAQREVIERCARATGRIDLANDPHDEVMRAVLLTAFWRTLRNRGGRSIVVAPTLRQRKRVMEFFRAIAAQDPAMQSVTSWPRWYSMAFGRMDTWEVRVPTPRAEAFAGLHAENLTVVVLDDGCGDNDFYETIQAARATCSGERDLFIQLWN